MFSKNIIVKTGHPHAKKTYTQKTKNLISTKIKKLTQNGQKT